jgi:hypothetical protein
MEAILRLAQLRPAIAAGLVLAGLGTTALRADPIPQNVLDANQKSCQQSCVAAGKPSAQCSAYCTCSTDSIEEKFSADEYAAMNNAIQAKQSIAKGSQDKLQAIVDSCKAKSFPQ